MCRCRSQAEVWREVRYPLPPMLNVGCPPPPARIAAPAWTAATAPPAPAGRPRTGKIIKIAINRRSVDQAGAARAGFALERPRPTREWPAPLQLCGKWRIKQMRARNDIGRPPRRDGPDV